jgi:hypothetical protein
MLSVVVFRVDRLKVKRRYEAPNFLSCSESGRTQAAFNAMLGRRMQTMRLAAARDLPPQARTDGHVPFHCVVLGPLRIDRPGTCERDRREPAARREPSTSTTCQFRPLCFVVRSVKNMSIFVRCEERAKHTARSRDGDPRERRTSGHEAPSVPFHPSVQTALRPSAFGITRRARGQTNPRSPRTRNRGEGSPSNPVAYGAETGLDLTLRSIHHGGGGDESRSVQHGADRSTLYARSEGMDRVASRYRSDQVMVVIIAIQFKPPLGVIYHHGVPELLPILSNVQSNSEYIF